MMTMKKGCFLIVTTLLDNIPLNLVLILHRVVTLQLKDIHRQDILPRDTHHPDTLPKVTLQLKDIHQQVILADHLLHITQDTDLAWGRCLRGVLQLQQLLMALLIWLMALIRDMVAMRMVAMVAMVAMDTESSNMASMESTECMAMENSSMANMESMECLGCTEESSRSGSKSVHVIGLIDSECHF